MTYNSRYETIVSVDQAGILEYWTGAKTDYKFPAKIVSFESKLDTDLYEFAKNKTIVSGLAFSPDGKRFATLSTDRKVRVFTFLIGKLIRVFDEALARYQEIQQTKHALPNMEFGRKLVLQFYFLLRLHNYLDNYSPNFNLRKKIFFIQNGNRT